MEAELIRKASEMGIWALACVSLVYYILKDQEKRDKRQESRELKYQEIIQELTVNLNLLKELSNEINELKNIVIEGVIGEKRGRDEL